MKTHTFKKKKKKKEKPHPILFQQSAHLRPTTQTLYIEDIYNKYQV